MKSLFMKYGRFCGLDFTFGLIKEKHQLENRTASYLVGCLTGLSPYRHIIVYGLCIVLNESQDTYYSLIKTFQEIMEGRSPTCYLTDQAPGAVSAFKHLIEDGIFTGKHYLDSWHLLRSVKTADAVLNKKLSKLLNARTENQYNVQLEDILSMNLK